MPAAPLPRVIDARGAGRATAALILLRIAYAYNWFDIGPGFPALSQEFGLAPDGWGLLLAAFLAGAGVLQVPSGLLARRYGARTVSLIGAALLGGAALACAVAPTFTVLLALRAAAGAGAGLFFSPAIALVGNLHSVGKRGVPVGLFSSAFSAGAGLGVFGSALLIPFLGWRGSLAVGGAALLLLLVAGVLTIPRAAGAPDPDEAHAPWSAAWPVLRSRAVWGIGLAFVGLEGASISAGQYFVPFAEQVHGWSPALAGGVASLFVFPSFFGGPFGGRLAERDARRRTQLALATAGPGVLLFAIPALTLAGTVGVAVAFSVGYGIVYAIMYILAFYLPGVPAGDVPLAIGLFNGIQLAGGACVSLITGVVIARAGFSAGWEVLAAMVLLPLGLLLMVPATTVARGPSATGPSSGDAAGTTR